jgi:hypothetical protein
MMLRLKPSGAPMARRNSRANAMVAAWLVCKMIKIQAVPSCCWLKDTVGMCIVIILIMSYRCTKELQLILQNKPNQLEIQMGAENLRLEVQLSFLFV